MNRLILLFVLAGLAGIALGIWGFRPAPVSPGVASTSAASAETPKVRTRGDLRRSPSPARNEPVDVSAVLSRLRLDSEKNDLNAAVEMLAENNPSLVENALWRIPDVELRAYFLNRIAIRWAAQRPTETAAWLRGLPEDFEPAMALISVGRVWAEQDPAQAAAYASQFPSGRFRQQVLTATLGVWINQDIEAASRWIIQADPGPDFDPVAAEVARNPEVMARHAPVALSWAEIISNEGQRRQAIGLVVAVWAGRDRAAAASYVQGTSALNPEQRSEMLEELRLNR